MSIVAVLVDGGFYQRRAQYRWGIKTPGERARELMAYCHAHVCRRDKLYRIFYYDCPPSSKKIFHPFLGKQVDLSKTSLNKWMTEFQDELRSQRKVALRLGELSENLARYNIKAETTKRLCRGDLKFEQLTESDFELKIEQKGVDMRIGVDIASMAYKKQVDKIVLISGDSDFVPAAKLARREGIDFVLDPMGATICSNLNEHIDGIITPRNPYVAEHNRDANVEES